MFDIAESQDRETALGLGFPALGYFMFDTATTGLLRAALDEVC
jgi:hypothetical protein